MNYFISCAARWITMVGMLVLSSGSLRAHEYWLEPDDVKVQQAEKVCIHLMFGKDFSGGVEKPLQLERTPVFQSYGSSRKPLNLLKKAKPNMSPAASVASKRKENILVVMERNASVTRFGRPMFLEYARQEGHPISEAELPPMRKSVFEKYTRYLKTLIQVDDGAGAVDTKAVGQDYEIVPLSSPFEQKQNHLEFQLLFSGKPCGDTQVTAVHRLGDRLTSLSSKTDHDGKCSFPITQDGRWLIRSVKIQEEPAENVASANYRSYWASLTFGYR